jgi:hypothetical protein
VLGSIVSDSHFVSSLMEIERLVGDKSDSGIDCTVRRSACGLRNVGSTSFCVCVCVCVGGGTFSYKYTETDGWT